MSIEDLCHRSVAFDDQLQTIHDLETLSLIYFFYLISYDAMRCLLIQARQTKMRS